MAQTSSKTASSKTASSKTGVQKITLSASRDIPFNKLLLSSANVRRIKAGVSIEQLADDIARRTLLQSITVRPVLDADGVETGHYEIPAGGRRFRALELLVRQKRLAKTAPVPCVIRLDGIAEEDSLAENVQRAPLHPLDQFRAFQALRERGQSEEEVAASFFVSVAVVKQRLRLASVSPKLLEIYAEDGMTLDQLMAFTVSGDHERQEQAWERLATSYTKEPYAIRRMLTEGAVRASDKRARFVGIEAYEAAGGSVLRDLFQGDDGGWLEDVALVDRLAGERLAREAEAVRAEGWRWVEASADFPYGHTYGLRRLRGEEAVLTEAEHEARERLQAEFEQIEAEHMDADMPDEVEARMAEIEAALAGYDDRPETFDPADIARAGVFVSIGGDGRLVVDRGYVHPEDEAPIAADPEQVSPGAASCDAGDVDSADAAGVESVAAGDSGHVTNGGARAAPEPDEDEGVKPLSDRLLSELTSHRTLALRQAVSERPEVAFLAALHAACLKLFYPYALDTCLDLDLRQAALTAQAPGLNDSRPAQALRQSHQGWAAALPRDSQDLWDALLATDDGTRQRLFAHCVALSVNGLYDAYSRRPRALAHADRLAEAVQLDMVAAGFAPTVESYLGRVTKAAIVEAVREAHGEVAARSLAGLKKADMAERAQELLAGSGWLPGPLRTPGLATAAEASASPTADIACAAVEGTVNEGAGNEGAPDLSGAADGRDDEEEAAADSEQSMNEDWPVAAE